VVYDPVRDRLVVFGGYTGSFVSDVWALTLGESPTWTRVQAVGVPPVGRDLMTAIYDPVGDRLVVFGGWSGTAYLNDTWALTLGGTPTWMRQAGAGAVPSPRRDYAAVYDAPRGRMVMFGGTDGTYRDETWALTLGGVPTWAQLQPAGPLPSGRNSHTGIYDAPRERMVVFGGYDGDYRNDTWTLSLSGPLAWSQSDLAAARPSPRMYHAAIYDPPRDRMLVFGGHPTFLNDLWELSLAGGPKWGPLAALGEAPEPRWGHAAIYDPPRGRMLVFGGIGPTGKNLNDVWVLTLGGEMRWSRLQTVGDPPAPRRNLALIFDPVRDRLVLYGGSDGVQFFGDVWELSLTGTPAWTPLTPAGTSPPGRDLVGAVYDPAYDRMVIFGGWSGSRYLGDTWELDWEGPRPVAPPVTLVSTHVEPGLARLEWLATEAEVPPVTVYRRTSNAPWAPCGQVVAAGSGILIFEDRDAVPGARLGYRLGLARGGVEVFAGETWLDVPGSLALALAGLQPNPATRGLRVKFTLAAGGRARLELLDLGGRRVLSREVGALGPGPHLLDLGDARALPAGLYVLRLSQGGRSVTTKACILR
jgi:hypothetical protein